MIRHKLFKFDTAKERKNTFMIHKTQNSEGIKKLNLHNSRLQNIDCYNIITDKCN